MPLIITRKVGDNVIAFVCVCLSVCEQTIQWILIKLYKYNH